MKGERNLEIGIPAPEQTDHREPDHPVPRIYVASLADYNNAVLHGTWVELSGDTDALRGQVTTMLAASPTAAKGYGPAEDWAIHDYEGLGDLRLGEYEDLDRLAILGRHVATRGQPFLSWAALVGLDHATSPDAAENFDEAFWGTHDSAEDFGESLLDDMGFDRDDLSGLPETLKPYVSVDVRGWVRDMELGGEISLSPTDGGTHVFWTS